MCNILQFPNASIGRHYPKPFANLDIDKLPKVTTGAKAALEKAINKTLENENHVVAIEDEIMIFLFLEGFKIVPIEGVK